MLIQKFKNVKNTIIIHYPWKLINYYYIRIKSIDVTMVCKNYNTSLKIGT